MNIKHWEETPLICDWCEDNVHQTEERYIKFGNNNIICERCFKMLTFEDLALLLDGEVKQG